ncbi:hypothetical protein LXL04_003738 [Taraxacum kok-saghyz]
MNKYTICNTRVLHGLVANEAIERGVHAAKCGDLVANDQGFAEYTIKRTKDKLKLEGTEDHLEGKLEVWDAGIDRHRVIRVLGSRLTTSFSSCSNKGDEETSSSSPTHRSDSPPPGAKPSQPGIGDFKTSRTNTSRNLPQFGIEGGIEGLKGCDNAEVIALNEASRECIWLRSMTQLILTSCGLKKDKGPQTLLGVRNRKGRHTNALEEEATWEDYNKLGEQFPNFHLENKVRVWAADIDKPPISRGIEELYSVFRLWRVPPLECGFPMSVPSYAIC